MKRKNEIIDGNEKKSKKLSIVNFAKMPLDLLRIIIPLLDFQGYKSLTQTSKGMFTFFRKDEVFKDSWHKLIQEHCLNFTDTEDLSRYLTTNLNIEIPDLHKISTYLRLGDYLYQNLAMTKTQLETGCNSQITLKKTLKIMLRSACIDGNILLLRMLLKEHDLTSFINKKTKGGMTPLGLAAYNGRRIIFSILLENQAKIQNIKPIRYDLGFSGELTPITPIHIIALRFGKDWLKDIFHNYPRVLDSVFTKEFRVSLIHIFNNDYTQLKIFLENHPSLISEEDSIGWNLLDWISSVGEKECMAVLLEKDSSIETAAMQSLKLACAVGNLEAMQQLTRIIEEFPQDCNYLHIAAYNGHAHCIPYLVEECQLNVNARNLNDEHVLNLEDIVSDAQNNPLSSALIDKRKECMKLFRGYNAALPEKKECKY